MRLRTIAFASAACALLTACGDDGYYDSRGHWHEGPSRSYNDSYNGSNYYSYNGRTYYTDDGKNFYTDHSARKGDSAGVIGYDRNRDMTLSDPDAPVIIYKRAGYYDMAGNYYPVAARPPVARTYFPPRGMCRVWLDGVLSSEQPGIESCEGIQYRAPAGSYIMYGG